VNCVGIRGGPSALATNQDELLLQATSLPFIVASAERAVKRWRRNL
jgi:hypothetical protein